MIQDQQSKKEETPQTTSEKPTESLTEQVARNKKMADQWYKEQGLSGPRSHQQILTTMKKISDNWNNSPQEQNT